MVKALDRQLGLRDVVAISLSTMIGSGIFVLPGLAAAKAGPSVWLAYLVAGLCVLPAALSKAELATAMPTSGGTYVFLERTWGPLIGSIAGLGLWLSLLLKSSFALVGFAAYLWVIAAVPLVPTALTLLAVIALLNLTGVKAVGRVQQTLMVLSVTGVSLLALLGGFSFEPRRLEPLFPNGGTGFLAAAAFVFVSYAGVTKVAAIAEEVKNPSRNLPRGMLISLFVAAGLYAAVTLMMAGNIPLDELSTDLHPVYTLALRAAGPVVGAAAAVLAILAMTSMANAGLLASSRFPFAMARDDLVPKPLGRVNPERKTPVASIVLTGAVMAVVIVTLDVEAIAKLASSFKILIFILVNITLIVLRESRAQWYRPPYRAPFYPWLQGFGIVTGLVLLVFMGWTSLGAVLGIVAAGGVLYLGYGRARTQRHGVFGLMKPRRKIFEELPPEDITMERALHQQAPVAVPIFGRERSPEMLVEVGTALADGRTVEVLHVTEVPEQTVLTAAFKDDGIAEALERRVTARAAEKGHDVRFETIVSRDVAKTVRAASVRLDVEWLVIEWRARSRRGLVLRNPLSWLLENLDCNLALFRDAGVRYIRRILVHAVPGPHDALVVVTADHLASIYDANLTFVRFVPDAATDQLVQSETDYLQQLRQLCEAPTEALILRGEREIESLVRATASYDLLVQGAPSTSTFRTLFFGTRTDRLVEGAACSVLTLRTPPLQTHDAYDFEIGGATTEPEELLRELHAELVAARADISRKDVLFAHLGELFQGALHKPAQKFTNALWKRERSQNTSIGMGVAMPHGTLHRLDHSYLGVVTTAEPIDYQAPDGNSVDVFFVLFGPPGDREAHLRLLATVSRLVLETPALDGLRAAESAEEIAEVLDRCGQKLVGAA